jgi:hypothetical protein
LATPNYSYDKRQRERAKKQKKEEKLQRKSERKVTPDDPGAPTTEQPQTDQQPAPPQVG